MNSLKIIPASLICLLFASMPFARVAEGQDTVHTMFGDRRPNTEDDLRNRVTTGSYTWEVPGEKSSEVAFKADGTGKQASTGFTWSVKSAQEIELSMADSPSKATIKFSDDYATYYGADFDGHSLHGKVVVQEAPTPTPLLIAATPKPDGAPDAAPSATPAASNPFLAETSPATSTNDALEQAIVNSTYTWEPEGDTAKTVTFRPNGVGQNTFFPITWRIKGPHELEIAIPGQKAYGKIVLRFSSDFSKYTATDFDGASQLKGHKK